MIEMVETIVCGYLIMQHPITIRANTAAITVTPHLIIQEGIVPNIS